MWFGHQPTRFPNASVFGRQDYEVFSKGKRLQERPRNIFKMKG